MLWDDLQDEQFTKSEELKINRFIIKMNVYECVLAALLWYVIISLNAPKVIGYAKASYIIAVSVLLSHLIIFVIPTIWKNKNKILRFLGLVQMMIAMWEWLWALPDGMKNGPNSIVELILLGVLMIIPVWFVCKAIVWYRELI